MSICAHILVLFRKKPTAQRIAGVEEILSTRCGRVYGTRAGNEQYERLIETEDADSHAVLNDDGSLRWCDYPRSGPLIGSSTLQGRLYRIDYLSRHWSESYPEGPAMEYVVTLLTLLAQTDIEGVWFVDDYFFDGDTAAKQTPQSAHQMLDDHVRVGPTFGGKPVRYMLTDDGHCIEVFD